MNRNFCTLFDKNYIFRGLALYYSLRKNSDSFVLWILCMDDQVYDQLFQMKLESVRLIKLKDLEDEKLLAIKPGRTISEYCWTLSSSLPLHVLKQDASMSEVTYLDSDLYFYSPLEKIYEEMGDKSIFIIRHNYTKELQYLEERSGIYNVALVVIKNDEEGIKCLNWWREKCLEWCFSRLEDGKFGDQMYLNDWPERFKGVCVSKNKGVNLAPWNINKYHLSKNENGIFVEEDRLVFYHFHSLKMFAYNDYLLYQNFYLMRPQDEMLVYNKYIQTLNEIMKDFENNYPTYNYGYDKRPGFMTNLKYWLKKKLYIIFYLKSLLK